MEILLQISMRLLRLSSHAKHLKLQNLNSSSLIYHTQIVFLSSLKIWEAEFYVSIWEMQHPIAYLGILLMVVNFSLLVVSKETR